MADQDFLDMATTHAKVMSTLRRNKVSERIIEEVSAQFTTERPTMRAKTHTSVTPKIRRVGALHSLESSQIPYWQGYSYITVIGNDGVDIGQRMWVVMCPQVDGDKIRAEIREKVRDHGIRTLPQHLSINSIYPFPKVGAQITRSTAMKHPGLYLEARYPGEFFKDRLELVVVHQK